jgi:hypothetical protein
VSRLFQTVSPQLIWSLSESIHLLLASIIYSRQIYNQVIYFCHISTRHHHILSNSFVSIATDAFIYHTSAYKFSIPSAAIRFHQPRLSHILFGSHHFSCYVCSHNLLSFFMVTFHQTLHKPGIVCAGLPRAAVRARQTRSFVYVLITVFVSSIEARQLRAADRRRAVDRRREKTGTPQDRLN